MVVNGSFQLMVNIDIDVAIMGMVVLQEVFVALNVMQLIALIIVVYSEQLDSKVPSCL